MPKKCVGVELIAIFNPGVSASFGQAGHASSLVSCRARRFDLVFEDGTQLTEVTESGGRTRTLPSAEAETPGLKIAINSTPTHYFGTRYHIECQKVSYTLYIVSKSVLYIQLMAIFNPGVSASKVQSSPFQQLPTILSTGQAVFTFLVPSVLHLCAS